MFGVELFDGIAGEFVAEVGADFAVDQAAPDSVPVFVVVDPILEPVGVIAEAVLFVASVGEGFAGAFVGDGEGEDGEDEEEEDEEEHDEEVNPEEPFDAAAGADETGEGDQEEENSDDDDGGVEEFLTVGGALPAEPYPTHYDWN